MNSYFLDERVRVAISRTPGAGATAQANQAGTWAARFYDLSTRRHHQPLFLLLPVKCKLISADLFFIPQPLIGSSLNMLCNNVNKTGLRIKVFLSI
jgi:hypothetical protein